VGIEQYPRNIGCFAGGTGRKKRRDPAGGCGSWGLALSSSPGCSNSLRDGLNNGANFCAMPVHVRQDHGWDPPQALKVVHTTWLAPAKRVPRHIGLRDNGHAHTLGYQRVEKRQPGKRQVMAIVDRHVHKGAKSGGKSLAEDSFCAANNIPTGVGTGPGTGLDRGEFVAKFGRRGPLWSVMIAGELSDALARERVLTGSAEPFAQLGAKTR